MPNILNISQSQDNQRIISTLQEQNLTIGSDYPLSIKRNLFTNLTTVSSLGFCDDIQGVETSVASGLSSGEQMTMTSTAKNLAISSTSIEDSPTGTGASVVNVRYLDSSGNLKQKIVILNGQTQVSITSAADIVAIGIFVVVGHGSGSPTDGSATNVGDLWIGLNGDTLTGGKPDGDFYGTINAGSNTTQNAVLLCGANQRLRIKRLQAYSSLNGNDTAQLLFKSLSVPLNQTFTNKFSFSVGTALDIDLTYQLDLTGPCVFWTNAIRIDGSGAVSVSVNINALLDSEI